MNMTVAEIAEMIGGEVVGDPAVVVTGVNGIREAGPGDLCFVRDARYGQYLDSTAAAAVLIAEVPEALAIPAIKTSAPDLAFAQVLQHCAAEQTHHPTGIHPSAVMGEGVTLGNGVALDSFVRLADNVTLGDRVVIYSGAYIGRNCHIGADTVIYPNAVIRDESRIGARCIIHSGACIGSDGFGFAPLGGRWMKIPQIGRVEIGDDCEVGSLTAIDRATFGVTRLGEGVKIDNLVQVGHNVEIGDHSIVAGKTGIAGSAIIGKHVRIGAQSGINGHIDIGDGATVAARSGVTKSLKPGAIVSGFPARPHTEERKITASLRWLPDLVRRVKALERLTDSKEDSSNA